MTEAALAARPPGESSPGRGRVRLAMGIAAMLAGAVAAAGEIPEPPNTERAPGGPLPPAEVCATARLPPGFRLEVFAAEPAVRNPIAICTDARGRVWVAENSTWAGNRLGVWDDTLRDRIVVLADTDGDGRHDERTVFWDGGSRVTSVAVGLGGAWVATWSGCTAPISSPTSTTSCRRLPITSTGTRVRRGATSATASPTARARPAAGMPTSAS